MHIEHMVIWRWQAEANLPLQTLNMKKRQLYKYMKLISQICI